MLNWGQKLETRDCSRRLCLFPTCQVRISRFYLRVASAFSFFPAASDYALLCELQICWASTTARSQGARTSITTARAQWALPDLASARSQCAVPDLNRERQISVGTARPRERQISVGTARPQPRAPDLSRHCQTSTASARSQWALPDLNRERQISVGTARPQP